MPRFPVPGLDGVPVAQGDTVLATDPDHDGHAVCGTLIRQRDRWFVTAGDGRLVPVTPADCQLV